MAITKIEIRILQWREMGDDDDTTTTRILLPGDERSDHDFLCDLYGLDPALEFHMGGIVIINTESIYGDSVYQASCGHQVRVTLEPVNE